MTSINVTNSFTVNGRPVPSWTTIHTFATSDPKPDDDELVTGDPDADEEGGPDVANDEVTP